MNNLCQAGHDHHTRIVVDTDLGEMTVYDWNQYKNFNGYCTGQDDVSRTLINTGSWENQITKLISSILINEMINGIFIDVGCNVGWYSRLARQLGYKVMAYDGDKEHLELMSANAPGSIGNNIWFDNQVKAYSKTEPITLMKCDIEGNEQFAFKYFERCFKDKLVKNLVMEVSPVFNNSYPELVNNIVGCGYEAIEVDGVTKFNFDFNFKQKDLWFRLKE